MPIERPLSIKELEDYLQAETSLLLVTNRIYEIGAYGWLNEDTVDPEYAGHAMAQIDPPGYEEKKLMPWQKDCAIAHADFQGIMEMARLSMGFAFFHGQEVKDNIFLNDNNLFNLHWMGSVVALSTAADRIRELFVTSIFEKQINQYQAGDYKGNKRRWYITPFLEAKDKAELGKFADILNRLPPLAEQIQAFRETRNSVIHKIATHVGEFARKQVNNLLPQPVVNLDDYQSFEQSQKEIILAHKRQVSATLDRLKQWYELLIEISKDVFFIEYEKRHGRY